MALGKSLVSLPRFLHQWNNYVWIPQAVLRIWQYSLDWIKMNALKCQPVLFSQQIKPRDCTRPATLLHPISSESLHSFTHCLVLPQGLPATPELSLSLPLTHNTKKSILSPPSLKIPPSRAFPPGSFPCSRHWLAHIVLGLVLFTRKLLRAGNGSYLQSVSHMIFPLESA